MWQFWRECTAEKAALNTRRKVRLCNYSQSVMHETLNRAPIDYAGRRLHLEDPKSWTYSGLGKTLALEFNGPIPSIAATIIPAPRKRMTDVADSSVRTSSTAATGLCLSPSFSRNQVH